MSIFRDAQFYWFNQYYLWHYLVKKINVEIKTKPDLLNSKNKKKHSEPFALYTITMIT